MSKNLVIVESPAKAKTIEKYLGKDFTVKSSFGHVRDLAKGNHAIDIANGFKPSYIISEDKEAVVKELKKLAAAAEVIWLATDDDREGEAISWHLKETLGLKDINTKRIVFREITKNAILKAIESPRGIDYDLVNAQQARRILDRLVGFELSPVLWKKIAGGLSAGRVQSVAVRLVVEREREIEKFKQESFFKVNADFSLDNAKKLLAQLPDKITEEKAALTFLERCKGAVFTIADLQKKPAKRSPSPPFTTSTLQQEASVKFGFSVAQTMIIAQKLYESGFITYMRTDSLNLSQEAIAAASTEINKSYGEQYVQTRVYKTKSKTAQEAHEAIRPTDFGLHKLASGDAADQKLYELIWKRAIASQMADAQLERTIAKIDISTTPEQLVSTGEVIKFDGFLKIYESVKIEETDDDEASDNGLLPPLSIGQKLNLDVMKAAQRFSKHAARYTEATLVKKLEEMGIGRPSTYAPTISTIQQRDYAVKESREGQQRKYLEMTLKDNQINSKTLTETINVEKNKLFPTNTGMIVNDFLVKHFPSIIDFSFTAKVEEQFDQIAHGKTAWAEMISAFYGNFHPHVLEVEGNVDRASSGVVRVIGTDPVSGKKVTVRLGKYGPYAQIGEAEGEIKPVYASLKKGQFMESITLEDALELFKLPREVGNFEGKKITAAIGRFGPYLRHDEKFISLDKNHDPLSIDETTAISLIINKREADAKKIIREFVQNPDLKVLNGRWGAYIAFGSENYKIPKTTEPASLSYEDCLKIINEADAKNIVKEFPQNPDVKLLKGKYGAYISFKKESFNLPKGSDAASITLEQCIEIIESSSKKKTKAPAKGKATAKTATKKAAKPAAKTPTKKK